MPDADLVVIPLPTGRIGNTGTCSVLFAPRLRDDGPLSDWPDWSDWPAILLPPAPTMTLSVLVNGALVPSTRVSFPSSRTWAAVFRPATAVERHIFVDRSDSEITSFPGGALMQQVRDLYGAAAVGLPGPPPPAADVLALPAAGALLAPSSTSDPTPLGAAETYSSRVGEGQVEDVPPPEFHEWLTMLASHPSLLRDLGLVVDLEVDLTGVPLTATVRVNTTYAALGAGRRAAHFTMKTGNDFRSTPDSNLLRRELVGGWLRCADPEYSVFQMDAFEAAVRLGPLGRTGGGHGLPVLRSGGVGLYRDNQAEKIQARMARQVEVEDQLERFFEGNVTSLPDLFAEDVTAGFRFDVLDDTTGAWRSIQQRTALGPYELPRDPGLLITPPDDENTHILTFSTDGAETRTPAAGFGGNGEDGKPKHPHEKRGGTFRVEPTTVSWYGWSLAVSRPGRIFDSSTSTDVPAPTNEPDLTADVQLAIDYGVPAGTLPSLRFGHTYSYRGRAVDVAGNSLNPSTGAIHPPEAVSPTELYGRTEVVAPPIVMRRVARPDPGVGDTTLNIVLKSDYNTADSSVTSQDRVLFPPPVHQYLCELHGLPNGGTNITSYGLLSRRDAAEIEARATVDADTGELVWTETVTAHADYLCDPAALGVAVSGAPGAAGVLRAPWAGGAWPTRRGGRITVSAGTFAAVESPAAGVFARFWVPKATDTVITLSSTIDPAFLGHFEHYGELPAADRAALSADVLAGQHWAFSAPQKIHVVHAVRRPLARPRLSTLTSARASVGAPDAQVAGPILVDAKSTGALVLRGRWTETVDDPASPTNPGPTPLERGARARTDVALLDDADADVDVTFPLRSRKRVLMTVTAEAISRFVDYFTEERAITFTTNTVVLDSRGVVASTVVLTRANGDIAERDVDYEVNAIAGTVRRIGGGAIGAGATVTARYVRRPVSRLSTEAVAGATATVLVPASLAPPPPLVHEVVPAYSTTQQVKASSISRVRNGRLLRVWLERPWMVSGDLERLAVVVDRCRIARDPGATGGAIQGGALTTGSFPRAAYTEVGVDGGPHTIAAHNVSYDAARGRWYCDVEVAGDIEFPNGQGYRPWFELAVARHQVDAIDGQHLSPLVIETALRLGPHRTTTVKKLTNGSLQVIVLGIDHDGVPDESGGLEFNDVTVTVQSADPAVADTDLRWVDTGQVVSLVRTQSGRWARTFTLTPTTTPARLVIVEREPVARDIGAGVTIEHVPSFVETIDLPASWVPAARRRAEK